MFDFLVIIYIYIYKKMTIQDLVDQLQIRLDYLKVARLSNIQLNRLEMVVKLDVEILETEQTIQTLKNS